ncbi:MAG TPA: Sir2 family NAD-dependent protein deacetylase [Kofleriaceae bacterium]|nr:Sir2 family NAD-dependent protein deacetylase [Kofleriaceae bacterium]
MDSHAAVTAACRAALARPGRVLALTGAGVSAESGIPTFRGKEGYWTVGAREYHPQELATHAAFEAMPWQVWAWYLYRRGVCRRAAPNAGHVALVELARALPDRFALITQNVDGLHRRAGSPDASTFPIHGDISLMRCADDCVPDRWPIPEGVPDLDKGEEVPAAGIALLRCPRCGAIARPHVLWFDESYDEPRFHLDTVRRLAAQAALLVIVGTSAQTNLPRQVVTLAARNAAVIVDINVEDNPFGAIAAASGGVIREASATALPTLTAALIST